MPSVQADTLDTFEKQGLVEQQPGTTVFRNCTFNIATEHGQLAAGDASQVGGQGGSNALAAGSSSAAMHESAASSGPGSMAVVSSYRERWRHSTPAKALAAISLIVAVATTIALITGWMDVGIAGYAISVAALLLSAISPLVSSGT